MARRVAKWNRRRGEFHTLPNLAPNPNHDNPLSLAQQYAATGREGQAVRFQPMLVGLLLRTHDELAKGYVLPVACFYPHLSSWSSTTWGRPWLSYRDSDRFTPLGMCSMLSSTTRRSWDFTRRLSGWNLQHREYSADSDRTLVDSLLECVSCRENSESTDPDTTLRDIHSHNSLNGV